MKKKGFTSRGRAESFKFALNGIKLLIAGEPNARIHCLAAVCVLIAGGALGLSRAEWIAVAIVSGAVLAAEAVNSSIEALADRVSPGYDEAIKRTKDLAAGAVLLTAITAAIVGSMIFLPKIMALFK
ncbi:diacylglycerol kinase family protein [Parabacteroides sp. ZJ-118]|uniref:diacylglycerol kinase family protein n=1 Tax=Parabacteroides sp. ZJ-118 TaxID=2709398 RepID=UPI0013EB8EAA|nr:diacylglycerol kinase family protein [Parabacteroides sp. ZJ-118]